MYRNHTVYQLYVITQFDRFYGDSKIRSFQIIELGTYVVWIGLLLLALMNETFRLSFLPPRLFASDTISTSELSNLVEDAYQRQCFLGIAMTAYAFFVDFMGVLALRQLCGYFEDRKTAAVEPGIELLKEEMGLFDSCELIIQDGSSSSCSTTPTDGESLVQSASNCALLPNAQANPE